MVFMVALILITLLPISSDMQVTSKGLFLFFTAIRADLGVSVFQVTLKIRITLQLNVMMLQEEKSTGVYISQQNSLHVH